ncbi:MCE family protein [Mycobacterium sp. CVI_P3]|uniref:MCE family protein n=1 Tax=Mycobacterium pinniadriaticum TaxID=2994102 RepID=A0ABT3SLV4_9MYCO|nr:MCE family protein [Mycobacterium pinniadriaticum]MCX2934079.1 MCE family protein [Mycobacterium pinniadriaticum]MCX2940501.1 MCE family protein [Mycobacterium pinniadriaticum]
MSRHDEPRVHPAWWTAGLVIAIVLIGVLTAASFNGWFSPSVPVTLTSDRSGLVMEPGARVKMRGLEVGRVAGVTSSGGGATALNLKIDPEYIKDIPANVGAKIDSTTVFGAKFVDLVYPEHPTPQRLRAGQVLQSRNVTTEVNTVFDNLVTLLDRVDPAKLNAILSALGEGFRGQGPAIGEATSAANDVLLELNSRSETVRADWRSLKRFSDAYGAAASDILAAVDSFNTTAATLTDQASALDSLLVNVTGLARAGTTLVGSSKDNLVHDVNALEPTTELLMKYHASLTCLLVGAKWFIDNGGAKAEGGNGYSIVLDATLTWGQDPYRFPDNLPIVGAKGGPGGKPGCGSLPDVTKQFPVRQLVTNTGWGTGNDIRVNPGIGFPGWTNYFPVTRAVPEPPSLRNIGPPAPGPIPYPGAPPYGAQLYAPDGSPLYPGLPPAPPPGAPREPGPAPGSEPFSTPFPAQLQPTPLPPAPPAEPGPRP